MTNVVIASAGRTAVGSFLGSFANTAAHDLGATVIEGVVQRAGIDKGDVSETILGQVLTAAQGQNPARQAHINAGLPKESPGDLEVLCQIARETAGAERQLIEEIGCDPGHGLGYVEALLDIETYVFAGGFAGALDVLTPGIRAGLAERRFGPREADLRAATLGSSAGWIGAARLSG